MGDGHLDVVEGTDPGPGANGSVYALDGTTGAVLWRAPPCLVTPPPGQPCASGEIQGEVVASVATADLTGDGHQDVIVATTAERYILDGRTGMVVAQFPDYVYGQDDQSTPLVTNDPDGNIGITFAFFHAIPPSGIGIQGTVQHFEVNRPTGVDANEPGAWPMFHHDPQLTGDAGGTPPVGSVPACTIPAAAFSGYDEVAADGGIFSFGGEPFCGSTGNLTLNAPDRGDGHGPGDAAGYWLVAADGGVFAFGDAALLRLDGGRRLNRPDRGHGRRPRRAGLLAGGRRRRGVRLRRRPASTARPGRIRLTRRSWRHGRRRPTAGLLAGRRRRRGVRLRRRPVLRRRLRGSPGRPDVGVATDTGTGGYWTVTPTVTCPRSTPPSSARWPDCDSPHRRWP